MELGVCISEAGISFEGSSKTELVPFKEVSSSKIEPDFSKAASSCVFLEAQNLLVSSAVEISPEFSNPTVVRFIWLPPITWDALFERRRRVLHITNIVIARAAKLPIAMPAMIEVLKPCEEDGQPSLGQSVMISCGTFVSGYLAGKTEKLKYS